jgi:hypothetical protein
LVIPDGTGPEVTAAAKPLAGAAVNQDLYSFPRPVLNLAAVILWIRQVLSTGLRKGIILAPGKETKPLAWPSKTVSFPWVQDFLSLLKDYVVATRSQPTAGVEHADLGPPTNP